jgi:predicted helicase
MRNTWITEGVQVDFSSFIPLGTKEAKKVQLIDNSVIVRTYSSGVKTNRDDWAYDFNHAGLEAKILRFVDT